MTFSATSVRDAAKQAARDIRDSHHWEHLVSDYMVGVLVETAVAVALGQPVPMSSVDVIDIEGRES